MLMPLPAVPPPAISPLMSGAFPADSILMIDVARPAMNPAGNAEVLVHPGEARGS